MTIKPGDKIPNTKLYEMGAEGSEPISSDELFAGKKVAMFGLPGAFTPTCSAQHLPGYVQNADAIRGRGIDEIVCFSVNDAFVMGAWAKDQGTAGKVRMIGDGSADFTKAAGLELDRSSAGMGLRCQRFLMVVNDGIVESIDVEAPGAFEVSSAEMLLGKL